MMKSKIHILIPVLGLVLVLGISVLVPLVSRDKGVTIEVAAVEAKQSEPATSEKELVLKLEPEPEQKPEMTSKPETELESEQEFEQEPDMDSDPGTTQNKEAAIESVVAVTTEAAAEAGLNDEALAGYEGQIAEADMATGQAIAAKLDTDYLNSLTEGGLTEEEAQQLQDYLHANLSDEEYAEALDLYIQYMGLMQ